MTKEYELTIGGKPYKVGINSVEEGIAKVVVNGVSYEIEIGGEKAPAAPSSVKKAALGVESAARPSSEAKAPSSGRILSPLPGVITAVEIREGQSVRRGQRIAVLEAMKMDNDILSEKDGTVLEIFVRDGQSIKEGEPIARIGE